MQAVVMQVGDADRSVECIECSGAWERKSLTRGRASRRAHVVQRAGQQERTFWLLGIPFALASVSKYSCVVKLVFVARAPAGVTVK